MSFKIDVQSNFLGEYIVLEDTVSHTRFSVFPQHGGMFHELYGPSGHQYLETYANEEEWHRLKLLAYRSAKLSPFACRIKKARYQWEGEKYELPQKFVDGSAIHGLVSLSNFTIHETFADAEQAALVLHYEYPGDNPGFPFRFHLSIAYQLLPGGELRILTSVTNTGTRNMPLTDGWHPYFQLGIPVDDCRLTLNVEKEVLTDPALIPTGETAAAAHWQQGIGLRDVVLDNCFQVADAATNQPTWQLEQNNGPLSICCYAEKGYPYIQVYTPDHRQSIALENISLPSDAFNQQPEAATLAPKHTAHFVMRYVVK